jgi:hypothetical protein
MEEGVGLGPTPALRALAAIVGGPIAMIAFAVFGLDLEGLIAGFRTSSSYRPRRSS